MSRYPPGMRGRAGTVVVALALIVTGCGDGGSDTDADAASATTTAEADEGPCELVTVEAVAEAFGQPAEMVDARPYVCEVLVDGTLDLTVQRMDGADPEGMDLTACAAGTRVEVEAGDAAHACITEAYPAPFGAVSRGDVAVWIGTPADTDAAVRERIAALLPLITVPG